MTLAIAIRRSSFVVLGADRLASPLGPAIAGEPWGTVVQKIALHRTLPIGAVMLGVATLDEVNSATVIGEVLSAFHPVVAADPSLAATVLAGLLDHRVKAMRAGAPPELVDRVKLEIAVGFALDGQAGIRLVELTGDPPRVGRFNHMVHPTEALEGYFTSGQYATDDGRFGPDVESAAETVARVRSMILDGIQEEEGRLDGVGIKCGFGADVAIVDGAGARFV